MEVAERCTYGFGSFIVLLLTTLSINISMSDDEDWSDDGWDSDKPAQSEVPLFALCFFLIKGEVPTWRGYFGFLPG